MSFSLVKKSLDLVDTEYSKIYGPSEGNEISKKRFLGRNKSKQLKNKREKDSRRKAWEAVQKIREKAKSRNDTDKVQLNVERLLKLSATERIHKKVEDTIVKSLIKKGGHKETNSTKKKEKEERSAFTEEDFVNFEKEYFIS